MISRKIIPVGPSQEISCVADRSWRRLVCVLLVSTACVASGGCFGGEYKRRMEQTISSLKSQGERAGAVFAQASAVYTATGETTGISLRLPVFVDDKAKSLKGADTNAQPPFADLPGYAYTYEIPFNEESAYVYFAALKVDEKPAETLEQEVQAAIGNAFSGAAWQDVTVERFKGGPLKIRRLSGVGNQKFGSQVSDGRFDLYLVSSSTHHVLIGWRASSVVGSSQGFFEKASISMGTVEGNS